MGDRDQGKAGVVRELVAGAAGEWNAARAELAGEQLPMFPVPVRARGSERARRGMQREAERRAAPGRPEGAENLVTRDFRRWVLSRGVSPLVWLMRYALMPPEILANELGCTKLEAFRELKSINEALAPYLHSRLAFVDDTGAAVPLLQMVLAGQASAPGEPGMTPWAAREALALGNQQNQGVGAVVDVMSHAAPSHEGDK